MIRSRLALVLLSFALLRCEEARRPSTNGGGGPSQSTTCTPGQLRCSGDVLQRCGTSRRFDTLEDCGDSGKTCGTGTGTIASCLAARCSTGATGGRCNDGSSCSRATDCVSSACSSAGVCVPVTCGNARQDGMEEGPDCGGLCPLCFGARCSGDRQCVTNYCREGACAEPSCTDTTRNGAETGVDCGGPGCPACPVGSDCREARDCTSGRCEQDRCAALAPSCTDAAKNGVETDVDCGGTLCGACSLGKDCMRDGDCLSAWCNFGRCDRPTCSDQIQNQGETDVDCGGPACPGCADGKRCTMTRDCASGGCEGNVCTSCNDGIQNGSETGPDCGGTCGACDDGRQCTAGSACTSNRCEGGVCASCGDNRRSGAESDVDCGGPCAPCTDGRSCATGSDCTSRTCESRTCCTPNACGRCGATPFEDCNGLDDDCNTRVDDVGQGSLCPEQRGVCSGARALCGGFSGWSCGEPAYRAHNAAYSTADIPCDRLDNDCNGSVDEVTCPADSTSCTIDGCNANGTCGTPVQDGTGCGGESPYSDIRASHYNCLQGACRQAPFWCQCYTAANGGGCNSYDWRTGTVEVDIARGCACSGSTLTYRDEQGNNRSVSCSGGCFRTSPPELNGRYVCF